MNTIILLCAVSILIGYLVTVVVKKNMKYQGLSTTRISGITHGIFTALALSVVNLILPAIDAGGISLKFLCLTTGLIILSLFTSVLVITSTKSIN